MLLKVNASVRDIKSKVINSTNFGLPKYQSIIGEHSELLVYESFSFRNSNNMSITVVIESRKDHTLIHYVPLGSSQGLFIKFDWGAKGSKKNKLLRLLTNAKLPYRIVSE